MRSGKLIVFFVAALFFVGAAFFTVQTFAQQAPPPVFGCLGLGGQQCSFLQVGPPKTNLTVNKKPLKGSKRIVHYGDTITGSVNYTNTGSLPLNISKLGVIAKKGSYEVLFTPSQGQTVLQPGQSINLPTTFHKFNYPDPPGDWSVAGRVVNTDNQSVDGNNPDLFTLIADCTPLRAIDATPDADKLNQYCQDKPDNALCKEFCEVEPDLAKNCQASEPGQLNPPGGDQDPNASQPGQQDPQQPDNGQNPQQPDQNPDQNAPDPGQPNQPNIPNDPGNNDPGASNPGQPNNPNTPNDPGTPNVPNDPNPGQLSPEQNQPDPGTQPQNPIEEIQKSFQEFMDELKRIFGL